MAGKRKKGKVKKFTRGMQKKLALVFMMVVLVFVGLNIRITFINAESGEEYTKQILNQQNYSSRIIPYKRGDILDANGTKLATSQKVYNVILDAKIVNSRESYREPAIKALHDCFGIENAVVEEALKEQKDSRYIILAKQKTNKEAEAFVKLQDGEEGSNLKGIWLEEDYVRTYPYSSLAAQTIGFTVSGNEGNWGIEQYYNNELNGINGREYGYWSNESELARTMKAAENGNSVVTNLDIGLQEIVERHMNDYMTAHANEYRQGEDGAENISILMMDPRNGAVKAIASYPGYDLNNPRDLNSFYSEEELAALSEGEQLDALNQIWRNSCISETFEPGSTVKPITVSAALNEGKAAEGQTFTCTGSVEIGGEKIHCVNRNGHGTITLEEGIMKSCNVVLMSVGKRMGKDYLAQSLSDFNMGKKTGIDLPGEDAGITIAAENMTSVDLATNSFGQNYNTTMIQTAAAFSATINGGNYYQPQVAKQIIDSEGGIVQEMEPVLLKQPISKDVSNTMKNYLLHTVETGTAADAQIPGYSIGGKTGTAQKHPRKEKNYVISFIGYVGQENPEMLIYVVIDTPNLEDQAQSGYATRLAHDILAEALPYLNIYPDGTAETAPAEEEELPSEEPVEELAGTEDMEDTPNGTVEE